MNVRLHVTYGFHFIMQLQSLFVNGNYIGDVGVNAIRSCLHLIKLLTVHRCNLSEDGIKVLKAANEALEQVLFGIKKFLPLNGHDIAICKAHE